MIETGIPAILGSLSHDLIFVCDTGFVVREANPLTLDLLGSDIIGQPLLYLLHESSCSKGQAFLDHIAAIASDTASDAWELLFNASGRTPLLLRIQARQSAEGQWFIVGTYDSPQLTGLYHEVLAMNSQLTNMIRELSKEQARLNSQIAHLLEKQEYING